MAAAAPSTAPANPLEESLAKITGSALSQDAGTADLLSYENLGYRAPQADVINISGSPGTGATTAETWSHDIALENLKREQLQFEYDQQQAEIANALRQQEAARAEAENQRAAEQLGLTKQTTAQQLATSQQQMSSEAQRQAQTAQQMQYATTGEQRVAQQAVLDAQYKTQQIALAKSEEKRKADEAAMKYGAYGSYENMMAAQQEAALRQAWSTPMYQSPSGSNNTTAAAYYGGPAFYGPYGVQEVQQASSYMTPVQNQYGQVSMQIPGASVGGSPGYSSGSLSSSGYYTPSGGGLSTYVGAPGSASYYNFIQAANPANKYSSGVSKPSYTWV